MITSVQNSHVQWVKALQGRPAERRREQAFVVEGVRLAEEALASGWPARLLLYTSDMTERARQTAIAFAERGVECLETAPHVLQSAADTQSPQGLLVVLTLPEARLPEALNFVLIPDQVRDPGNLGTILRAGAAAGVQAVLLPPASVDPYSPKVLRAGMGAHFHMPVLEMSWPGLHTAIETAGLHVYLADSNGGLPCPLADFSRPLALLIGGEADGAGPEGRRLAHERVHIPMPGGAESLNAAIAAGVLMYEVVRQRGSFSPTSEVSKTSEV